MYVCVSVCVCLVRFPGPEFPVTSCLTVWEKRDAHRKLQLSSQLRNPFCRSGKTLFPSFPTARSAVQRCLIRGKSSRRAPNSKSYRRRSTRKCKDYLGEGIFRLKFLPMVLLLLGRMQNQPEAEVKGACKAHKNS